MKSLSAALLLSVLPVAAFATPTPFVIDKDHKGQLTIEQFEGSNSDGGRFEVLLPSGKTQELGGFEFIDDGKNPGASFTDFNFDGYNDIAIDVPVGMVNFETFIYLWQPEAGQFKALKPNNPGACGQFSDVTLDEKNKTIISSCRGGPVWYSDKFKYDDQGKLYLASDMELNMGVAPDHDISTFAFFERYYDPQGKKISQQAIGIEGEPYVYTVKNEKLRLYNAPNKAQKSAMYLVKGDQVAIVDLTVLENTDKTWVKIKYASKKRGDIYKWVAADETEHSAPQESAVFR